MNDEMKQHPSRAALGGQYLQRPWIRAVLWVSAAAAAAIIFAFSAQAGDVSTVASRAIVDFIIRLVEGAPAGPMETPPGVVAFVSKLVRKAAHFAEFALLGFCLRLLVASYGLKRPTRLCWLIGSLYAVTDELHQLFVADRACMWQDVLLDSAGVLAGITCAYALLVTLWRLSMRFRRCDDVQTGE